MMRQSLLALLLLTLLTWCSYVQAGTVEPGLKISLGESGVSTIVAGGLELLSQELVKLDGLNVSETVHVDIIGNVTVNVTDIRITNVTWGPIKTTYHPGVGVNVQIDSLDIAMISQYAYEEEKFPHLHEEGELTVNAADTNLGGTMAVTQANGRPQFHISDVTAGLDGLKLHLSGGLEAWFIDLLKDLFMHEIKKKLDAVIVEKVTDVVNNDLNGVMMFLPMKEKVGYGLELNYALTSDPTIAQGYVVLPLIGMFERTAAPSPSPYTPVPMPDSEPDGKDALTFVSQAMFTSMSWAGFEQGLMKFDITNAKLPAEVPFRLNTTNFRVLIPDLYTKWPNRNMSVQFDIIRTPEPDISTAGLKVVSYGNLTFSVLLGGGNTTAAFVLNATSFLDGNIAVTGNNITGDLSLINMQLRVLESNVGTFDVVALQSIINLIIDQGVLPEANALLKTGFALPSLDGISLSDASIALRDAYADVEANIKYVPTYKKKSPFPVAYECMNECMKECRKEGDVLVP